MVAGRDGSVVLADPDTRDRGLMARTLRRVGFQTIEVTSGFEALEAARSRSVALILLEVPLSGMTGYEVCHELRRERGEDLAIVFISATRNDAIDRVAGLLLGADEFLAKPLEPSELVARVGRLVARPRASTLEGENGVAPALTSREGEVLDLLAEGLVQKEIARELSISPKTVGTHIQKLLLKLQAHSRAELVARAYRTGLVSPLHDRRAASRAARHQTSRRPLVGAAAE